MRVQEASALRAKLRGSDLAVRDACKALLAEESALGGGNTYVFRVHLMIYWAPLIRVHAWRTILWSERRGGSCRGLGGLPVA